MKFSAQNLEFESNFAFSAAQVVVVAKFWVQEQWERELVEPVVLTVPEVRNNIHTRKQEEHKIVLIMAALLVEVKLKFKIYSIS